MPNDGKAIRVKLGDSREHGGETYRSVVLTFPPGSGTARVTLPLREGEEREVRLKPPEEMESLEDSTMAVLYRGGYSPLFALAVVRQEDDGTLTAYLGREGTHAEEWDADLGPPEPVNAPNLPDALRRLADELERTGGGI